MAEAKPKTNLSNDVKDKWKELIEKTRENYLKMVDVLTKVQSETEKVINNVMEKGNSYKEDGKKLIKEWIEKGNQVRENLQKTIEENIKKSLSIIPNIESLDFPFKKEFEQLSKKVQEQIKKVFELFKIK